MLERTTRWFRTLLTLRMLLVVCVLYGGYLAANSSKVKGYMIRRYRTMVYIYAFDIYPREHWPTVGFSHEGFRCLYRPDVVDRTVVDQLLQGEFVTLRGLKREFERGDNRQTSLIEIDGRPFVLKEYRDHLIGGCIRASKSTRYWNNAAMLSQCVRVAEPAALFVRVEGGIIASQLLLPYVGDPFYHTMVRNPEECITKVRQLQQTLKENRMIHGDMKSDNIIQGEDGELILVDLDSSRRYFPGSSIFPTALASEGRGFDSVVWTIEEQMKSDFTFEAYHAKVRAFKKQARL